MSREEAARYVKEWLAKSKEDKDIVLHDIAVFACGASKEGEEDIALLLPPPRRIPLEESAGESKWKSLLIVNLAKIREVVDAQLP